MITKFKIFESIGPEYDLAEQFSQKYIEDFFDNNFEIGADEASRGINLWNFVKDKDQIKDDLIKSLIEDALHDNESVGVYRGVETPKFSKEDYIYYIEEEQLKNAIPILNKYRKKLVLGDIKYEDILKKLTKEQLVKIVAEDLDKSDEFFEYYFHGKYDDSHPEDILNDIWGEASVEENLYDYIKEYVNDDEIIKYYKDKLDFTAKFEYLQDYIGSDIKLQTDLLALNPDNVDDLFDVMNEDESRNIGKDYKFQKAYIEHNSNRENPNITEKSILVALAGLYDKFGLNSEIEKEYSGYMYEIDARKYNL
jgi:hypothetical protein